MNIIKYSDLDIHKYYTKNICENINLYHNFNLIDFNKFDFKKYCNQYFFISDKNLLFKIFFNNQEFNIPIYMSVIDFLLMLNLNKNIKIYNSYNIELFNDDYFNNNCYYHSID